MKFTVTAILLLSSLTFLSCKKTQAPLTEQEVINVINRFDEGWSTKNLKEVDSVLAPAYIYFTQSGGTFSRDSVVQTAGSSNYILERVQRVDIIVKLYENTAVVSTRWKGKGIYRDTPFDEDQRCSVIIIKSNNKVEILSEHCTPVKTARIFH